MNIKIGSKGDNVKKIQERLGLKGDGIFGKVTESAVKSFQIKSGLKSDGIVGTSTWSKLFETKVEKNETKISIALLKGHIPEKVYNELLSNSFKFNIKNNLRLAHFVSQCDHESGGFKMTTENLNYSVDGLLRVFSKHFDKKTAQAYSRNPERIASKVYASRMGNGDESSKEGWKFRGRGYIQLTGKNNYIAFGKFIGEDVVNNPDLVANKYPLSSAAFFFNNNNIWSLCDKGSDTTTITAVTKRINGGTVGLQDRINKFRKYWSLLSN